MRKQENRRIDMGETTVLNSDLCAIISKYYRDRPQLKEPKSDIMGYEIDNKIIPFIESIVAENAQQKELIQKLQKTCNCPTFHINGSMFSQCEFFDDETEDCKHDKR